MAAEGGIRLRSSALILVLSGVTLVLGFAVQVVLAATLGTSREMDIFLVAVTLPTLLATVSLTVAAFFLVPALSERTAAGGRAEGNALAAAAVRWSALGSLVLVTVLGVGALPIVRATAPGLDPAAARSAALVLRIMLVGSFFDLLRGVLSAIQYSRERFLLPQLVPSFNHALLIASALLLLKPFGLVGLATGWTIGSLVMCVALLPALRGLDLLRPRAAQAVSGEGGIRAKLLPILLVVALAQLCPVVDRLVASLLPVGSISYLGYGSKMLEVLMRMVPMAVALGVFPLMSRLAAAGDVDHLRGTTLAALRWALLGSVPLALTVIAFRVEIVQVLFQRGAFGADATRSVAQACAWYAAGFVPATAAYLLNHVLFAAKRPWFLAWLGLGTLALTASLDLVFGGAFGFIGVALAFVAVSTLQAGVLGAYVHAHWGLVRGGCLLPFAGQLGGASLAMGAAWAAAWLFGDGWPGGFAGARLALAGGLGVTVFVAALWLLRNPELRSVAARLSMGAAVPGRGARSGDP